MRYDKASKKISLEDVFTFNQTGVENGKVLGDWVMTTKEPSCYHKFVKRDILCQDFLQAHRKILLCIGQSILFLR